MAERLETHFHSLLEQSDLVSLKKVQTVRNIVRLRNNIARLFTPYL